MELTIYSKNFEDKEDVSQNGFANNVFVEDYNDGISFYDCEDNLCEAIKYIVNENIDIDKITYCYNENGDLKYKRFIIKEERKEDNLMPYSVKQHGGRVSSSSRTPMKIGDLSSNLS